MENELYDIYTMWHVPFWQTDQFFWGVVLLAMGLSGIAVWLLVKKWRSRKIKQTPWQLALQQLNALKKNNRISMQQGKEFYHELTRIMKVYVHERYQVDVLSTTDQEFLVDVEKQSVLY